MRASTAIIGWPVAALSACGVVFGLWSAPPAYACAPAPPPGATVAVAAESAIIVWHETTKTEHFLRRATFETAAKDFGFLVPTPTKPYLAEVKDDVFRRLEDLIAPEVVTRTERRGIDVVPLVRAFATRGMKRAAAPPVAASVRVLEEKRVAGYDATVLEADDAGALANWLKLHGYAQRPALEEWLAPYVTQKWKITAFKIAEPADEYAAQGWSKQRGLATEAVRMTFQTERPFFPYREPRDQRESLPPSLSKARSLRVFFFGPRRVAGTIGDHAARFSGKTVWAAPAADVGDDLPVPVSAGAWLTVLDDDASPRPGVDELWLDAAGDPSIIKPPPIEQVVYEPFPLPLDGLAVMAPLGYFVVRVVRRKRRRSSAAPV